METTQITATTAEKPFDTVGFVMDFEGGELSAEATIDGFSNLVKTGLAWQLQGCYGRSASALIEAGYIDREGNVL